MKDLVLTALLVFAALLSFVFVVILEGYLIAWLFDLKWDLLKMFVAGILFSQIRVSRHDN